MYQILRKSGATQDNLWAIYTENGVAWTADTLDALATKVEELITTVPTGELISFERVELDIAVTAPATETPTEPTEP